MVDMRKLKELVKLMVTNDLTELDLQGEGERVTLKRGGGVVQYVPSVPESARSGDAEFHPGNIPGNGPQPRAGVPGAGGKVEEEGMIAVTSPMVGTFYVAPSPDADPFVRVGDTVEAETVVCLVEAMKVFNEIKAEMSGTIHKILVESGQAVEFGQSIMLVKPQ